MGDWIVVVDDEDMSLTSARTLLSSENMKISCLPSGKHLLRFMEKNNPDLILLDVMMPEMDGFETFSALREQEKEKNRPETPVIFLTGEVDNESERYGLKLGAADYIHKPFNKDIMVSRIRNTINNRKKIESLTEDATKDGLTGFLNKSEGVARVKADLISSTGALLLLDLDSFKLVNDLHGHDKGDQILKAFADLSRSNTREDDILCRIGGDEFLFFCLGMTGENALYAFTARLNKRLEEQAEKILGEDHGIPLGVSVGAVTIPEYGTEYENLFNMADSAMYQTKQNGKHGCTIYKRTGFYSEPDKKPEEELTQFIKIIAERNQGREAFVLGADAFTAVFNFIERFNSAYGGKVLMLLFLVKAKNTVDENTFNDAVASFGEVLNKTLKKSDIIMQNRKNQFFVMVPMPTEPDVKDITDRVMSCWEESEDSVNFEIKTASQIR